MSEAVLTGGMSLLFCLVNTTLHYAFFYIGLSHSEGSRAAILNSLSVFSVVIMACMFFKSDRMTTNKIVGCVIGFAGILSLNLGGADSGRFTWLGDGMIILNALCGATASLLTRGLGKRVNVFVGTGYSLAIGGVILVGCGLLFGGTLPCVTALGSLWLLLLIAISTVGFSLYNKSSHLQSCRQSRDLQLSDPRSGCRQLVSLPARDILFEICAGRSFGDSRDLYHQQGKVERLTESHAHRRTFALL